MPAGALTLRDPDGRYREAIETLQQAGGLPAPSPTAIIRRALDLGLPLVAHGRGDAAGKALATKINDILTGVADAE